MCTTFIFINNLLSSKHFLPQKWCIGWCLAFVSIHLLPFTSVAPQDKDEVHNLWILKIKLKIPLHDLIIANTTLSPKSQRFTPRFRQKKQNSTSPLNTLYTAWMRTIYSPFSQQLDSSNLAPLPKSWSFSPLFCPQTLFENAQLRRQRYVSLCIFSDSTQVCYGLSRK